MLSKRANRRQKIRYKIRKKINGTGNCPRLSVFRSNKGMSAQLIDDRIGHTLCSVSTHDKSFSGSGDKKSIAKELGTAMASKAKSAGISQVVFDRGGYLFHGRVKAFADAAREGGLDF